MKQRALSFEDPPGSGDASRVLSANDRSAMEGEASPVNEGQILDENLGFVEQAPASRYSHVF